MSTEAGSEDVRRRIEKLREAKLEDEIAEQLRLNKTVLDSLEQEDLESLPQAPIDSKLVKPQNSIQCAPLVLQHSQVHQLPGTAQWNQQEAKNDPTPLALEHISPSETEKVLVVPEAERDHECDVLTHTRCKTRRTCRDRASSSTLSDVATTIKPLRPSSLHSYHTAEPHDSADALNTTNEAHVEAPLEIKPERHSQRIGVALTTKGEEAELASSKEKIARSDDGKCTVEPSPPPPISPNDVRRHRDNVEDVEAGLTALPPASTSSPKKQRLAAFKPRRHLWRALLWASTWLTLFAVLCNVIGQYHTRLLAPSLSGKRKDAERQVVQQNRVKQHQTFTHVQHHRYTLSWLPESPTTPTQDLVRRDTTSTKSSTWSVDLGSRTFSNNTAIIIEMRTTSNHTLDVTSFCAPVKLQNAPNTSVSMPEYQSFSHVQHHRYTLPWTAITQQQKRAAPANTSDIWDVDLGSRMVSNDDTALVIDLRVTAKHTVDLRDVCGDIELRPLPKDETPAVPFPATPSPVSRRVVVRDSRAIIFTKNLLSCLWFLPIWLLSQWVVRKIGMPWLAGGEGVVRMEILAVVLSFLTAAALGLGTEVAVREIAEGRVK